MYRAPFVLAVVLFVASCNTGQPQNCDLNGFNAVTSKVYVLEYQHTKLFDNKFNSSIFKDTSKITVVHLADEEFKFQIIRSEYEWLYGSGQLIELNHSGKTKSIQDIDNIHETSLWDNNLLSMIDTLSIKMCELKSVHNTLYQQYSNTHHSRSKVDSNEIVITKVEYTFPKTGFDSLLYKEIVIKDTDTLQIQEHLLSKIRVQTEKHFDALENRIRNISYRELEESTGLPFGREPIREGDVLNTTEFIDIESNTVQIINTNKEYSLIVFSYIGCAPCEIALNQLREDKHGLRSRVNLYFSSFQNNNTAVKRYLENKPIFQNAFAMESNMIDEFRLPVSPTFVLIDANGTAVKIINGFDDSVLNTLYEIVNAG